MGELKSVFGSRAEDIFINIFADIFGAEKAGYLYSQYTFFDIYHYAMFTDDLLKQNSMIHFGRDVYRWTVRLTQKQPDTVKDKIKTRLKKR